MTESTTREAAWAALHRPDTDAAQLARIASEHPEFAEAIAAHPAAYPGLREWAAEITDAVPVGSWNSDASGAPAAVRPRRLGWLWIATLVLLVALQLIAYSAFAFDPVAMTACTIAMLAVLLVSAVSALLTAPGRLRKVFASLGSILFLIAGLIYLAMLGFDWDFLFWQWGSLGLLLVWLAVVIAYAVGRPIRGLAWIAFPVFGVLPLILSFAFVGFYGIPALIAKLLLLVGGVVLAECLTQVSERRITARAAAARASGGMGPAGVAFGDPVRTNTLAILSLVFAFMINVLGVILGHIALAQIRRTGEDGRGLAIAGLVIGYISVVSGTIALVVYVAVIGSLTGVF